MPVELDSLSNKFVAADQMLRQALDTKHHGSIQTPQTDLGGISPMHYIATGGDLSTILNMFPKHNIGG
jgi:hypothetical protein